jgi:hypothetical protein
MSELDRCDCGVPIDDHSVYEREQKQPPTVVDCQGCGRKLYLYGPNTCSHDTPSCPLFLSTCSHRLFAMHLPSAPNTAGTGESVDAP